MRYWLLFLFLLCLHTGETLASESYQDVLTAIEKDRIALKKKKVSIDSCKRYFMDRFEKAVFPHWVGTKWDYNGHTNHPGKDQLIACGYFVSTTLKHMGFEWNRYDLAKMYSKKIVEETCSAIKHYTEKKEALSDLLSQEDNLYIVGLDMHVGFLLKRAQTVYFIHSNYYDLEGPVKEIAKSSMAFGDSGNFYIGTFLNPENIQKWLNKTPFVFEK